MIRGRADYMWAVKRLREERRVIRIHREELRKLRFPPSQIQKAMEPMISFSLGLKEEINFYKRSKIKLGGLGANRDNGSESVSNHFQKELADPKFRRLYEVESKKVRLGFVINRLRKQARLTEAELGQRAGVTKAFIARLETGELRNYDLNTLKKIATALHKVLVIGFADKPKNGNTFPPKNSKALVAL